MSHNLRHTILVLVIICFLAAVLSFPPVRQDPAYHAFADQRSFFALPRFLDIATNLPFIIVGIAGLRLCQQGRPVGARRSWVVFFVGVALVGIGSAYYHVDPNDRTLVWDRLPMTAGFMGFLVAVLAERVSERIETYALLPAILTGGLSVLWWAWTGDLRPYIWVQMLPLLMIPLALLVYPGRNSEDGFIILSLMWYALAKVAEHFDRHIYAATGQIISGHSLKHLAAAAGCAVLFVMLKRKEPAQLVRKVHGGTVARRTLVRH